MTFGCVSFALSSPTGDLTKHIATHTKEKNHICYICGAKFGRNFYVKVRLPVELALGHKVVLSR
jgi:hypothetical protein